MAHKLTVPIEALPEHFNYARILAMELVRLEAGAFGGEWAFEFIKEETHSATGRIRARAVATKKEP